MRVLQQSNFVLVRICGDRRPPFTTNVVRAKPHGVARPAQTCATHGAFESGTEYGGTTSNVAALGVVVLQQEQERLANGLFTQGNDITMRERGEFGEREAIATRCISRAAHTPCIQNRTKRSGVPTQGLVILQQGKQKLTIGLFTKENVATIGECVGWAWG